MIPVFIFVVAFHTSVSQQSILMVYILTQIVRHTNSHPFRMFFNFVTKKVLQDSYELGSSVRLFILTVNDAVVTPRCRTVDNQVHDHEDGTCNQHRIEDNHRINPEYQHNLGDHLIRQRRV